MLPDRVSNPGRLTYESGALPIALRGPANREDWSDCALNFIDDLTHCILVDSSTVTCICWTSPFVISG